MKKREKKNRFVLVLTLGILSCTVLFGGCASQEREKNAARTATKAYENAKDLSTENAESVDQINQTDAALDEE